MKKKKKKKKFIISHKTKFSFTTVTLRLRDIYTAIILIKQKKKENSLTSTLYT